MKKLIRRIKNSQEQYRHFSNNAKIRTRESADQKKLRRYAYFLDHRSVEGNTVMYESYWGRGLVDSPLAIFKYLINHDRYKGLSHIWVIDSIDEVDEYTKNKYGHLKNVRFVEMESIEYFECLATAKWLVNNVGFRPYFTKRKEQIYINTWHGTPLKSMGYETKEGSVGVANIVRNYLSADYLVSANRIMTDMYLNSCKLEGIMPGAIIEEGYPRNDVLFEEDKTEIFNSLALRGLFIDKKRITVMYAPTWRNNQVGAGQDAAKDLIKEFEQLKQSLPEEKYQILVKPHQIVFNELKNSKEITENLIPSNIDMNELLCVSDVLVTDYSSVFFDFLCTKRPIVFYMPDIEEYNAERGNFKYSIDNLPGPICRSMLEVGEAIKDCDSSNSISNEMRSIICEHENGNATKRIVEVAWDNMCEDKTIIKTSTSKKKLLINGGELKENGITHAFISLLNVIDYDEWDVTAYVAYKKNDINDINDINIERRIEEITEEARVIVRVGTFVNSERQETLRHFVHTKALTRKIWEMRYPKEVYRREFQRCFGDASFDYIVDFNGFERDYVSMLLEGNCKKRSIWMHSDMASERERKVNGKKPLKEGLRFIASRYKEFDNLISCGETALRLNKNSFEDSETLGKFKYVNNAINKERIERSLKEETSIRIGDSFYYIADNDASNEDCYQTRMITLPQENEDAFVTMGRLSTEKNQKNLIEGFRMYAEQFSNSKLYIIGDGPLRSQLLDQIRTSQLEGKVVLTGNLKNPFGLMKQCDCFVLPSLYEGNPMVFHEARACNLAIIASDFDSVVDVCTPGGQMIVGKEAKDIFYAMCAFKNGEVHSAEENIDDYNKETYYQFSRAIV